MSTLRRLSKTFLTINAVFSFVFLGLFALCAIIFFIVGSPLVADAVANEGGQAAGTAYTAGMYTGGVIFLSIAIFALISGIYSNKAKTTTEKGVLIAAIVFSAISCTEFGVAGGILGLIANSREPKEY